MSGVRTGIQGIRWCCVAAILTSAIVLVACGAPTPATAVGHAESAPEPVIPESVPVIVFLGDSLTAGFGLAAKDALPEQVAKIFKDDGIEVRIINAGVSGDTTANGLARFGWSVAATDPDLVVVALGANDYLMGIDPEITKQNLSAIVRKAKESDIDCVLVDLQPRSALDEGSRDAVFAAIYPDLAAKFGLEYYPSLMTGVQDKPELLQTDGLHPTAQGVKIIARNLAQFLEPIVESHE